MVMSKVAARMKNASKLIRDWSKNNGNKPLPAHWTLTRGKLGLKTGKYCHLHGKGWHTTVVLQWLLDFTDSVPNVPPVLKSALWSANACLAILYESRNHSQLLTREVIEQCVHVGIFSKSVTFDCICNTRGSVRINCSTSGQNFIC